MARLITLYIQNLSKMISEMKSSGMCDAEITSYFDYTY